MRARWFTLGAAAGFLLAAEGLANLVKRGVIEFHPERRP